MILDHSRHLLDEPLMVLQFPIVSLKQKRSQVTSTPQAPSLWQADGSDNTEASPGFEPFS